MPPKKAFTVERAQGFGSLAAGKATDALGSLLASYHVTCTYIGTVSPGEGIDPAGQITARATLVYEWRIGGEGIKERAETKLTCKNASIQGIPFPNSWKTALNVLRLSSPVELAKEAARHECGVTDVECKLLGAAQKIALGEAGVLQPGATIMLPINGARVTYVLCAWVRGSSWLCHRGTFDDDGLLDASNPFDERSLVTF